MRKTTLEKMLESLVNGDQSKAEELFHEYVVSKSRDIYENLLEADFKADAEDDDMDDTDDAMGGDPTDDLAGELDTDMDMDMDMGDEGDGDVPELFDELQDIVDQLQAEFESMGGGDMGTDDMGTDDMDMDMDTDDMDTDDMDMDDDDMDMDDDDMDDSFGSKKKLGDSIDREFDTFLEYVNKVNPNMGDNGVDTRSPVAGKNDMGGSTANILSGGEAKGEGTKGGLAAPTPKEDNAGNVNVPNAKAGVKHLKKQSSEPKRGDKGVDNKSIFTRKPRDK